VAVLDGNDLLCDGLRALLNQEPGMVCVGAWNSAPDVLEAIRHAAPDILLIDLQMPGQSALGLIACLPEASPATRAIVMVDCPEDRCIVLNPRRCCDTCSAGPSGCESGTRRPATDDCLQTALKMGAKGAMQKRHRFERVAGIIRSVHAGGHWMELPTARRLAQQYLGAISGPAPERTPALTATLTAREREIAALIAQGLSNREICRELGLGYSTVKNYVSSILDKLGFRDRTQIALFAMENARV